VTPGWLTILGVDGEHKVEATFRNVTLDGLSEEHSQVKNADWIDEQMGATLDCSARFTKYPAIPTAPEAAVTVLPEDPTMYVAASGSGDFWSIQRAIDMAPPDGAVISVAPGTYREVLTITKPNITIRSPYTDATKTVIVFNKSAGDSGGTFNSATVNVRAPNFTAENITFANDWNKTHEQVSVGSQALAVSVTADRAIFRNVRLLGNQDTLYAAGGRQYFANCYIEGNVDFIFGDANAVFEGCEIHNTVHNGGYITAQGKREASQDSTYVFNHCKLTAEPGVANVWLGRPWRPYASVVFLNTEMGAHIAAAGWREWHPGETKYLDTVFYAEFNSTGPGAHPNDRDPHTKKLTPEEAARYETRRFLAGKDNWLK
jgi:pectin methylesterase-like acyl-CoA thioesterase